MTLLLRWWRELLIAGLVIFLILSIDRCQQNGQYNADFDNYAASLSDSIRYYRNATGRLIAEKLSSEIDSRMLNVLKKQNKELNEKLKSFPRIKNITTVETVIQVDTVVIRHDIPLPCDSFVRFFRVDSGYYYLAGKIDKEKITISTLRLKNEQTVITGWKREHWWRKPQLIVSVENSNPLIQVSGLSNFHVRDERRWYDNGWLKFGVGVAAGIILLKR